MDHGQDEHALALDLVDQAVGVRQQFADVVIAEFWHFAADARQPIEDVGLGDDVLNDFSGVVAGVGSKKDKGSVFTFASTLLAIRLAVDM